MMKLSKTVVVANRKGGTGKTTTTLNLGRALSLLGFSVLLVDLDSQANLSKGLGISDPPQDDQTILQPMWAYTTWNFLTRPAISKQRARFNIYRATKRSPPWSWKWSAQSNGNPS